MATPFNPAFKLLTSCWTKFCPSTKSTLNCQMLSHDDYDWNSTETYFLLSTFSVVSVNMAGCLKRVLLIIFQIPWQIYSTLKESTQQILYFKQVLKQSRITKILFSKKFGSRFTILFVSSKSFRKYTSLHCKTGPWKITCKSGNFNLRKYACKKAPQAV